MTHDKALQIADMFFKNGMCNYQEKIDNKYSISIARSDNKIETKLLEDGCEINIISWYLEDGDNVKNIVSQSIMDLMYLLKER